MYRLSVTPRTDWEKKCEASGFYYHHTDEGQYWDESAYYGFTETEIETLYRAAETVYDLYIKAFEWLKETHAFGRIGIPPRFHSYLAESWEKDELSIIGRFDFRFDGLSEPKLLEFNADTPTSLLEASVIQWDWLKEVFPEKDQFNSIHENLIASWKEIGSRYTRPMYFSCMKDHLEDLSNTEYLRDTARQAGLDTRFLFIEDLGYDHTLKKWVDLDTRTVEAIFKLYPWEWMMTDEFAEQLNRTKINWLEPVWKAAMSSKAMQAVLWEMFPNHPNLLGTFIESEGCKPVGGHARKPFFSREGANVTLAQGLTLAKTTGEYGSEGYILQELCLLPEFPDAVHGWKVRPVVGAWLIGGQPSGIGIRESETLITDNTSRFVPHLIDIV